jgi:hypothetical protein
MTLPEAEFIANEFNKFTSVQSAEVVPNVGGDYSVLVTRTDGRRAISRDLEAANDAYAALQIEESYAQAVYATLGEGNVPVACSRETWKAWWEENAGFVRCRCAFHRRPDGVYKCKSLRPSFIMMQSEGNSPISVSKSYRCIRP